MSTVFTCERPVRIRNKYTGEIQMVPCNSCNVCKAKRASKWVHRLNDESKCHPYGLWITLTYNADSLPVMKFNWSDRSFRSDDGTLYFTEKELKLYLDSDSIEYIRLNNNCLPYARISDLQKFIKRLRERVVNRECLKGELWNNSGERLSSRYLRYFSVSEYGETKFRPHFHLQLWTGSKWFVERAAAIVRDCWCDKGNSSDKRELGFIKCEIVKSSTSSYVASYLNCVSSLPKIYQFRQFRPKSFGSRCPPIGSLFHSSEEIQKLFDSGSVFRTVRTKESRVLQVPLEQDICNRLYPRIQGFDRIPDYLRARIYDECFQFVIRSGKERIDYANELSKGKGLLGDYFKKVCVQDSNCKDHSTLNNLISKLCRFGYQAQIFGINPKDYYIKIVDFWTRRNMELLKLQCLWQEEKTKIGLDPNFVFLSVDGIHANSVRDAVIKSRFKEFNNLLYDVDSLPYSVMLKDSYDPDFVSKVSLSKKVITDGKNKHIKFEYLHQRELDERIKSYHLKRLSKNGCTINN